MALGNLLDKLKGKGQEVPESFLALVLTNHLVQAAVWQISEGKTEIVSLGTPVEWDGEVATTNELVQAVDATISSATEGISSEPEKVIFGLANSWVDPKGILGSKKELMKAILKELELKPLGYVVLSDCILKYLKMQEGTPTTSLLIQIGHRDISLSLVKLGRIENNLTVVASDNLTEDIVEAIGRMPDDDPLPSRFIIVGSMENTSDIVQDLTAYDWTKKFHFLHTPKIEALPKDVEVHATAVAGGTEVATSLGIVFDNPTTIPEPETKRTETEALENEDPGESDEEANFLTAEDVGFSAATDPDPETKDLKAPEEPELKESPVHIETESTREISDDHKSLRRSKLNIPKFKVPHIAFPQFSLPKIHSSILLILLPIVALILGIFGFLYLVPKANLTILLRAKPLEQVISLNLSDQVGSVDLESKTVPALKSTQTVTGTKTVPVTGEKTIGDPAKGEVTIYNRTSLSKTFLSGTTLTNGSLKFTLDEDITIASKSAGSDYVDVPGKATAKITAKAIGAESNLGGGAEFTLATFGKDSYVAKNESALTGGTSQLVTVVGAADKKALIQGLTSDLLTQLKNNLSGGSGETYYLLDSEAKIEEEQYNHKVGEEANSLDGTLTLSVPVLKYQTRDVEALLGSEINKSIPAGYIRTSLPPTVSLETSKVSDGGLVEADARVAVYVLPDVNIPALKSQLKGKSASAASSVLRTVPNYLSHDLSITPAFLPPRLQILPFRLNNLSVSLTPSI